MPISSAPLIANARQEAESRFHPLAIARGHVKIYQEVVGNRG